MSDCNFRQAWSSISKFLYFIVADDFICTLILILCQLLVWGNKWTVALYQKLSNGIVIFKFFFNKIAPSPNVNSMKTKEDVFVRVWIPWIWVAITKSHFSLDFRKGGGSPLEIISQ